MNKYQIIYADPPWSYQKPVDASRALKYPTMAIDEICALPVQSIADDNCALFLWVTWPHYELATQVMRAWGFQYKTVGFVWFKTNRGKSINQSSFLPEDSFDDFMALGHWTRGNTEFCLIGVKGRPKRQSNNVRQVIYTPVDTVQSRKPAEARKRIVELMGDVPRIELFARQKHEGWHVWGNEVESDVELAA